MVAAVLPPATAAVVVAPLAVGLGPEVDLSGYGPLLFYVVVTAVVFVESGLLVGFFLPGDTLLFAAGLLVGDESRGLSLTLLITLVVGAAITGDSVGFVIGRRGGRAVLIRREGKALGPDALARVDRFMATWGVLSVIIARWIPWLRTFVPVAAGASDLPYPRFLMANVVGALCWGVTLPLLGYLAASTPWLQGVAGVVAAVVVTVAIVGGVVTRLRQRRRQTQS